ncbi:MAG: transcription antitermination protein NusB [Ruminococcus sp.]|jgi:N utilization substance protein B|nr:transcription antitermination protein NusB [Ruminococcus sp.]
MNRPSEAEKSLKPDTGEVQNRKPDPREAEKAAREALFYLVFESLFSPDSPESIVDNAYAADNFDITEELEERFLKLCENLPEIDRIITEHSQKRVFSRLPKVSAAILRVAFFEILYAGLHPNIAAAEAVRFATDFAAETDVKFVNGVLGDYLRNAD